MGIDLTFCHTLSSSDRHRKPTTRHQDRVQRVQSLQVWQHSDRGYLVDLLRRNQRQRRVELQRFVVGGHRSEGYSFCCFCRRRRSDGLAILRLGESLPTEKIWPSEDWGNRCRQRRSDGLAIRRLGESLPTEKIWPSEDWGN